MLPALAVVPFVVYLRWPIGFVVGVAEAFVALSIPFAVGLLGDLVGRL